MTRRKATLLIGFFCALLLSGAVAFAGVGAGARTAAAPSPHVVSANGIPADPNLYWCGTSKVQGPCALPAGAQGDHLSSPVPCHTGQDQVADCIKP